MRDGVGLVEVMGDVVDCVKVSVLAFCYRRTKVLCYKGVVEVWVVADV